MVASSGDALTAVGDDDGRAAWARLLRVAHLVTPNLPELARLTGRDATDWDAALEDWRSLRTDDDAVFDAEVVLKAEDIEPFVRNRNDASIWLDRRERIICGENIVVGECIKKCRFPHIR